jgi:hypothetical protein
VKEEEIKIIEMLNQTNILGIVGNGEENSILSKTKIKLWDLKQNMFVKTIKVNREIKGLKLYSNV